jgi:DNA-binding NarL/FixJ family response regulator
MRVLMVDDHVMVLQGLTKLLGAMMSGLQIDTASTLGVALELTQQTRYELILLDWHLDGSQGADAIEQLREAGCAARIVVLSGENSGALIRSAIELGAAGFVPKRYSSEAMVAALKTVLDGGIFLPPEAQTDLELDAPPVAAGPTIRGLLGATQAGDLLGRTSLLEAEHCMSGLTPRQLDVYRAAARGLPNKLIARELGISESTVKTHLQAVYGVLGVRNRTEAAYHASRERIRVG